MRFKGDKVYGGYLMKDLEMENLLENKTLLQP